MRLLDSSVWIEHLTGGARTVDKDHLFEEPEEILVSTINLYEVGRYVERTTGQDAMEEVMAHLKLCQIAEVTPAVAQSAVVLARDHRLHMADALIAATADLHHADLVTLDEDLLRYPGARMP